jgi:hypothetical protein
MKIFKIIMITTIALVAAAGLALGVVNNISLNHKITVLHHAVAAQQVQLNAANQQLITLQPLDQYATGTWFSTPGSDSTYGPQQMYYMPATTSRPDS